MGRPRSSRTPQLRGACATARPEQLEVIGPPAHHPHPLFPVLPTQVSAAHIIALHMRKLTLNRIRSHFPLSFRRVLAVSPNR